MGTAKPILGSRLREARQAAGLSMAGLAARAALPTRQAVYTYEVQGITPSLALIPRLAEVLGVSPVWLAGWTDEGGPAPPT